MTTTEPASLEALGPRLRDLDDRLGELAALIGADQDDVASDRLDADLAEVGAELDALEALVDDAQDDADPFATARLVVAARRDRFGFLELALAPEAKDAGAAPDPVVAATGPPRRPAAGPRRTKVTEGSRAASTGRVLSAVGLVLVGFFVYQLTGSAITHSRSQKVLLQRFKEVAPLQAADPSAEPAADAGSDGLLTSGEAAGEASATPKTEIVAAAEAPGRGEPIGVLQIPRLGLDEVMVQGSGPAELRKGPGHLRGTVMPGEPGNAAIAGSRLANGAPFRKLQTLRPGDPIDVTTAVGRFRYEVTAVRRVQAGDPDPARAKGGASVLTLITSTPTFLAYDRLVAVAELRSRPVAPRFSPVTPDRSETGFDTAPGGIAPLVGWGALLAAAVFATRWLYRRWARPVAYLLTTPVLIALLLLVFESLGGLLPSTF